MFLQEIKKRINSKKGYNVIKSDVIEYFVHFGLNCPTEVIQWSDNLRLNYLYNSTQYQNLRSVLCGSYCLCYINK